MEGPDQEWNLSLAGCGFRSVYHVGALSCLLEKVPQLVHGAARVCGASSGCLVAAALVVGIPLDQLCADIMAVASQARSHSLGVFHPTFSLLRGLRCSLLERLPADAHLRASGRLCVSLTRMRDWKNVLVSEFASRDDLIQVLMCSCFFPVYCGFIPPSYRGVLYVDGALSDNMPLLAHRNTVTLAPFSGESDICPREGTFNFFEVNYGNVSIQVNTGNVHRICTSFLPPELEKLSEICNNGYLDALRFLTDRGLHGSDNESRSDTEKTSNYLHQERRSITNLPLELRKVLCEACRESHASSSGRWSGLSFIKVLLLLLSPIKLILDLVLDLVYFATRRRNQSFTSPAGLRSESLTTSHDDLQPLTSVVKRTLDPKLLTIATLIRGHRHRTTR